MLAPTPRRRRRPLGSIALLAIGSVLAAPLLAGPMIVLAATAEDPSNVVLVFDVSNSILLSDDGTNEEFASALDAIADQVEESAEELAIGNATISFVAFGRTAVNYPDDCSDLTLHEDPDAVQRLAECLREIAGEYDAGADAPVRDRFNTQDTDHVAALRRAADLLPDEPTRSAVIFFTDGAHDPPGNNRDDEDVVDEIAAAYDGRSPLAILPVGLGAGAGAFESNLRDLFDAYIRAMEPCEGRASFSWPEVVFESAEDAGIAVAQALQEVTCSFVFVPPASATPPPPPTPTPPPTPAPPGAPVSVQLLAGNGSITVQWQPPAVGAGLVTEYIVRCRDPEGGVFSSEAPAAATEAVVTDLVPGVAYTCEVVAVNPGGESEATVSAESVVVLGIPAAPGQPRAEPMDAGARVSVDPIAGGAPAETYFFECSDPAGQKTTRAAGEPAANVTGLVNGVTYTCVAYAENRIGRSPASVASAAFSPCANLFACNPLLLVAVAGAVTLIGLVAAFLAARAFRRRNRVWITAQLDGGANLPLGWGPDIGIRLEEAEGGGLFAAPRPIEGADIKAQYTGKSRFLVTSRAGIRDVHQGDPAPVRGEDGSLHQLILRRYRSRPDVAPPPVKRPGDAPPAVVEGRLEGKEQEAPPTWDAPDASGAAAGAGGQPRSSPDATQVSAAGQAETRE